MLFVYLFVFVLLSYYMILSLRILLGKGQSTYTRAVQGLKSWQQFRVNWVYISQSTIQKIDHSSFIPLFILLLHLIILVLLLVLFFHDQFRYPCIIQIHQLQVFLSSRLNMDHQYLYVSILIFIYQ